MDLSAMGDARRTQGGFPSSNHRLCDGDGEEKIRFADVVVVEEIHDVGAERIGVEDPSVERDRHAELMLFIALPVERNKSQVVDIGKRNQRTGSRYQRRSLVIVPVESPEGPVEMRNVESDAE